MHRLQYAFRYKSISIRVNAIADTHWCTSVLRFFLPKKPEPMHFLQAMRSSNSFTLYQFLMRVAFSLVNLSNVFQLTTSGVNTDASTWLLPSDLLHTYSQTLDRMANFSQSKQVFSCNPMRGLWESRYKTSQVYFTCLLASKPPRNACMPATLGHFQTMHLQANLGKQTDLGSNWGFPTRMVYLHYISCLRYAILVGNPRNGGCDRRWSKPCQQLAVTMCIHTYKFFPQI